MFRWLVSVGLIVATLGNGQWFLQCKTTVEPSIAAAEPEEVPECCRHGICPHHAAEHRDAAKPVQPQKHECICAMTSDTGVATLTVTPVVALMPATERALVNLRAAGVTANYSPQSFMFPDLAHTTPPPRG